MDKNKSRENVDEGKTLEDARKRKIVCCPSCGKTYANQKQLKIAAMCQDVKRYLCGVIS